MLLTLPEIIMKNIYLLLTWLFSNEKREISVIIHCIATFYTYQIGYYSIVWYSAVQYSEYIVQLSIVFISEGAVYFFIYFSLATSSLNYNLYNWFTQIIYFVSMQKLYVSFPVTIWLERNIQLVSQQSYYYLMTEYKTIMSNILLFIIFIT